MTAMRSRDRSEWRVSVPGVRQSGAVAARCDLAWPDVSGEFESVGRSEERERSLGRPAQAA